MKAHYLANQNQVVNRPLKMIQSGLLLKHDLLIQDGRLLVKCVHCIDTHPSTERAILAKYSEKKRTVFRC